MAKQATKATAAATAAPATAVQAVATAPAPIGTLPNVASASVPAAPPKGIHTRSASAKPVNTLPRSTVQGPVAHAWALYAQLYAQHGVSLTRKVATQAAIAQGVAYYTARTQYQLWRQAMVAAATAAAGMPSA